jgi:hypothetical protein
MPDGCPYLHGNKQLEAKRQQRAAFPLWLSLPAIAVAIGVAFITYPAVTFPFSGNPRPALGYRASRDSSGKFRPEKQFFVMPAQSCLNMTKGAVPCTGFIYPYIAVSRSSEGQVLVWAGYICHQLATWWATSRVIQQPGIRSYLPAIHATFFALKLLHSYKYYDGLATVMPETLALYSVALMLWFALVIRSASPTEGGRGLLFGYGTLPADLRLWACRYHGPILSFGACFNLWYHPVEGTLAFVTGFAYQTLILTQSSLAGCQGHTSKAWTGLLEAFVLVHSVCVAWLQNGGIKPMFAGGFLLTTVANQLWYSDTPRVVQAVGVAAFLAWAANDISQHPADPADVLQCLRLPATNALAAMYALGAFQLGSYIDSMLRRWWPKYPKPIWQTVVLAAYAALATVMPWVILYAIIRR